MGSRAIGEPVMNAVRTLLVTAAVAVGAPTVQALAEDNGTADEQRDCINDAMSFCSMYIFAPDRNERIGMCLWQHRYQISRACYGHLRAPSRRSQQPGRI